MRHLNSALLALLLALGAAAPVAASESSDPSWPRRILLTNDNGIDDTAIIELARALTAIAEVHVVAATMDRSGSSNFLTAIRSRRFEVERRDLGEGITAYALDGYPADCVLFALAGPLRETPPDLVISGINGGPNLADEWFGSGTIGAARTAAYLGVPAIAVSGVEDDDPAAVRAAVDWTVALATSEAARALQPPQYLTVSLPVLAPQDIQGVELVRRARGMFSGAASPEPGSSPDAETWRLELRRSDAPPPGTDAAAFGRARIAVVAMRVDEHDAELHAALAANPLALPQWSAAGVSGETSGCRPKLGMMIGDAEDERGVEWGVLVGEVMAGGRGAQLGFRTGDVIVRLDGAPLARPGPEDPDERFVRLLTNVPCGKEIRLTYVRDGRTLEVAFLPVAYP